MSSLINFHHFSSLLVLLVSTRKCLAEGFDAGDADPLKFGLIDPLALEIGATYTFIVPFIIFTLGIIVIPAALVILFLIISPLWIPTSSVEGRSLVAKSNRSGGHAPTSLLDSAITMFAKSQCANRVICEMYKRNSKKINTTTTTTTTMNGETAKRRRGPTRKVFDRSSCSRFICAPFELLFALGNTQLRRN